MSEPRKDDAWEKKLRMKIAFICLASQPSATKDSTLSALVDDLVEWLRLRNE